MSIAIIKIDAGKLSYVKKLIHALKGSIEVVKDAELEEMLEDRWLGKMIDEAEKEPGEISAEEIKKMFAGDGITL
jgi:hypothetical protein